MNDLPEEIRQFIAAHVTSVAQLELLLLLRSEREREWTASEVGRALYADTNGITEQLNELLAKGLLYVTHTPEARYRYRPDGDTDTLIGRLATLYQERRVAVISLIYAEPTHKARSFADAFRIRTEKDN